MRPAVALLVVYALSPVSAHAQTSLGSSEQPVIVEGCLSGKRLKPDKESAINNLVFGALQIKELRLEGQPALMKTLQKQHDGHQDQISGIVIVPADKDVKVQGKQVGKRTRITTTQSGGSPDPRPPAPGATRPASAGTTSSPLYRPARFAEMAADEGDVAATPIQLLRGYGSKENSRRPLVLNDKTEALHVS